MKINRAIKIFVNNYYFIPMNRKFNKVLFWTEVLESFRNFSWPNQN